MAGTVPAGLTRREGRRFGLQVGAAFALLAAVAHWRGHARMGWLLAALAFGLLAGGIAAPAALGPVYRGWMRIAHAISRITTPIVLGIMYFLVITPIGLLLRATGQRPLSHDRGTTAWTARIHPGSDLKRQF